MSNKNLIEISLGDEKTEGCFDNKLLKIWASPQRNKGSKKIQGIIQRHADDAIKHFKEDGWDLDVRCLVDDIIYDITGFHVSDVFMALVAEKVEVSNYYHKFGKEYNKIYGYSVLGAEERVFYNPKKDRIEILARKEFNAKHRGDLIYLGIL